MTVADWGEVVVSSLQDLWTRFIGFLPNLLGAIFILIVGWYVAQLVEKLIVRVLKIVWIDTALKKIGIKDSFEKVGIRLNIAKGGGFLVKWFLFIVFIIAASELLGLEQVTEFLNRVVAYIPNVVVAVIILLLGVLFANFAQAVVKQAISAANLLSASFLANFAKWSILVFSILAALVQLKVAADLLQILFTGFVSMLALAGGLAFGLGGREKAHQILEKISRDLSDKKDDHSDFRPQ